MAENVDNSVCIIIIMRQNITIARCFHLCFMLPLAVKSVGIETVLKGIKRIHICIN